MGKSTIDGSFSIAMLNYQRVSSLGKCLMSNVTFHIRGNRWEQSDVHLMLLSPTSTWDVVAKVSQQGVLI